MKTPRRQPIEPVGKFAKALERAQKTGIKLEVDEITITPPLNNQKSWRLFASFKGQAFQRRSRDNFGAVNAAFIELSTTIQTLRDGAVGLPEFSSYALYEVIEKYIQQGGPKSEWRGKSEKNRREDFSYLINLSKKEKIRCLDLNASVIRRYIDNATASSKRAKGMLGTVRTFIKWGVGAGYFTSGQLDSISHVVWSPPKGSNYQAAPSRRAQSKLHFGTADSPGGEVMTHEQTNDLGRALQKYYKFGEALVHVSSNIGTRGNETFILTASRAIHEQGLGNFVDLEEKVARIHWQYAPESVSKKDRVTKNNKFRSVVIPPVENISCNYDVTEWLTVRSKEALREQKAGKNPLALIFPSSTGRVINITSFSEDYMRKALDDLGWRMPAYKDARGKERHLYRFTLHSLRDRFGTTAADEWGYTERQLLEQGSWADSETVRKFYLGTTDATFQSVKSLHENRSKIVAIKRIS